MSKLKHEVTEIAPRTWCLSEFRLVNVFLVEGDERAALIDAGFGIGDLAGAVRELTDKPLVILITHGHLDHDGGMYQFPGVETYRYEGEVCGLDSYSSKKREKQFGVMTTNQRRSMYIKSRGPLRYPEANLEELLELVPTEPTDDRYEAKPMTDGMEIDLGGRVLKIIHTPGHTPGEVCVLDETSRTLFTGDTANPSIVLFRQPNNSNVLIEECNQTMSKLWALESSYDKLGVGHDAVTLDKQIIKDYVDMTAGLLDGSLVGSYEEVGFRKGDVARLGMAELWYRCDE